MGRGRREHDLATIAAIVWGGPGPAAQMPSLSTSTGETTEQRRIWLTAAAVLFGFAAVMGLVAYWLNGLGEACC